MIPLGPVVARGRARAPRTTVWASLADAGHRAEWWPELGLEAEIGATVTLTGDDRVRDAKGTVDVCVAGHALGFAWQSEEDGRATAVLVTLRTQGRETGITVTETGFDAVEHGAAKAESAQRMWQAKVAELIEYAESAGNIDDADSRGAVEPLDAPLEGEFETDDTVPVIEVDPEPQLGEYLELGTGEIPQQDDVRGTDESDTDGPGADELRPDEPSADGPSADESDTVDSAAEEAAADGAADDGSADDASTDDASTDDANTDDANTDEPDFDDIIRGTR